MLSTSRVAKISSLWNATKELLSKTSVVQNHLLTIVGQAHEYSGILDDAVSYDIDTLHDHLRTFASTVTKFAHLQNVVGKRFELLVNDLSSFSFQRNRNYSTGYR
jgi:hypothetical protein